MISFAFFLLDLDVSESHTNREVESELENYYRDDVVSLLSKSSKSTKRREKRNTRLQWHYDHFLHINQFSYLSIHFIHRFIYIEEKCS